MKIVIICGSRRPQSQTRRLTDIAFEHAKKKTDDVNYIDLGKTEIDNFRGFDEKYSNVTNNAVKLIETADVIIIGSPIYNALPSSGIKNLFEFVNYKALEGKVAAFIIKAGSQGTLQQVRGHLVALTNYFDIISNPKVVFSSDEDFEGDKLKNDNIRKRIIDMVDSTIRMKEVLS